jgi:hypothetical protein
MGLSDDYGLPELLQYEMPLFKVIEDQNLGVCSTCFSEDPMRHGERIHKVNREKLLAKVKENRARHAEIYEEALEGYRVKCFEVLNELVDSAGNCIKEGKYTVDLSPLNKLIKPQHALDTYDTVISTLEFLDDVWFELNDDEMKMWVLDKWSWQKKFLADNKDYSGTARLLWSESE